MVASLILAVIVLGSAFSIFHARNIVSQQLDKLTAVEMAS
jgi:hypothetical protein